MVCFTFYIYTHSANLPEQDSVRPDVSLGGEVAVEQSLNGHPAERQEAVRCRHVHLVRREQTRHAKVRHFEHLPLPHQDVAAGQVTVHYAQTRQVLL